MLHYHIDKWKFKGQLSCSNTQKVTGNQKVKFLFSIVRCRYMAHFIFDTFGAGYKTVWSERHKGAFVSKDIDKCTLKYDIKNDLRYLPSSLSLRCKSLVKKQTLSIYVVNINTKIKDMNYTTPLFVFSIVISPRNNTFSKLLEVYFYKNTKVGNKKKKESFRKLLLNQYFKWKINIDYFATKV